MTTTTRMSARDLPRLPRRLPDEIDKAPAPIAKVAAECRDLWERADEAIRKVRMLEAKRPEAERADREAHAAARRQGKGDPGPKAVEAWEAEFDAAWREATGFVDATHGAYQEVHAALSEGAPAWREKLHAQQAKQIAAGSKAFDDAEKAIGGVAETRGLLRWIDDAMASINGDRRRAIPKRFPNAPRASTTVLVGQVRYEIDQVLAVPRAWLDGDPK
jgi:hypothetical protein